MAKLGFEHRLADQSQEAKDFDAWYLGEYGDPLFGKKARSSRYYELRKSWLASKKYYAKEVKEE